MANGTRMNQTDVRTFFSEIGLVKGVAKMNPEIRKKILMLNARGLSVYYIQKETGVKSWIAKQIIESELKEDFNSLFRQ